MKMHHLKALKILETTGDETRAWATAQLDEGLLPEVTQTQWLKFARTLLNQKGGSENSTPSVKITA